MGFAPTSGKQLRLQTWLPHAVAVVLLCAALWVLHDQLQAVSYHQLQAALAGLSKDGFALAPWLPAGQIVASLLLFRLVYYVLPLSLALLLLVADVVGIDIRRYLGSMNAVSTPCRSFAIDFEGLSHAVQHKLALDDYLLPVLVG